MVLLTKKNIPNWKINHFQQHIKLNRTVIAIIHIGGLNITIKIRIKNLFLYEPISPATSYSIGRRIWRRLSHTKNKKSKIFNTQRIELV